MGIDDTGDNVYALLFEPVRVFQHLIRFSDPWRSADVDTKVGSLMLLELARSSDSADGRSTYVMSSLQQKPSFSSRRTKKLVTHSVSYVFAASRQSVLALWTSVNRFSQNSRSFSLPPHCAPNDKLRDAQRAE
jgi:hypothetical protein